MLNNIVLVGRLTKEPESFKNKKDEVIMTFSLAFNQGENDYVEYIDCVAKSFLSETISKYLVKGDKIAVVGTFTNAPWTTKDGQKRTSPKIYVDSIEFIDVMAFNAQEEVEEEKQPQKPVRQSRR